MANELTNGVHYLSGVERSVMLEGLAGWHEDELVEADLFVIDGVTFAAYIDPDDGYRSYGIIAAVDAKCCYTFPPQKVIIENREEYEKDEEWGYTISDVKMLVMTDAILNKEVLKIGTDYTDGYYPCAIFDYQPMNLYVNVERSMKQ